MVSNRSAFAFLGHFSCFEYRYVFIGAWGLDVLVKYPCCSIGLLNSLRIV